MTDHSGPSRFQVLFEAAFRDYEKQTGKTLANHPLAEKLQSCDSIESVTAVLREQTETSSEIRGKDKVLKPLKNVLSVLHKLSSSSAVDFGQHLGLPLPPLKAIHTGLGILLSAVKGVLDDYDTLADLLESVEHFLNRLDIYTKIPPTSSMIEMIVKILVELLSILALATKQLQQGKLKALVKRKLLGGKDIEAVLQRLDRLTEDEARITAAQTLEVVYGLFQNMRDVVDDGKTSINNMRDALEIMQKLASDMNRSKRDKLEQDIRRWLSPPDPWKNHNIACKSRHPGSAAWFLHGNTYPEWKASVIPGSLLWLHGKPGAGKSVLSSTIVEDINAMRKAGLASLAFFYCDFREDQMKDIRGLLSSLLVQFCHQSDSYSDILSNFYSEHANGSRHPSDGVLIGCLKDLLKLPGHAPVYLIVDALDECPNTSSIPSPRYEVLNLIEELVKSQIPNLRVCVTSRPEAEIKEFLDPLVLHTVSLHDESGQKRDIEEYIKSVIDTNPRSKRWKSADKQLAINALTEKAEGMFRWVYCQLVEVCGCIPARIPYALDTLPETLDETYERTLREIHKPDWEFAHRLFQFITVAVRPLRVEELAELLAFDFEAGSIPNFHEDWRPEDPIYTVLSTCPSFLVVAEDKIYSHCKVIQFSHVSVKEFLTSARLAEATDVILRRYHISETHAHTLAARACLGYLLHLDKDVTRHSLRKLRFAEYSAEYWVYHARPEDVSRNVKDGLKRLFDPSKPHLAVCIWICDPSLPLWESRRQSERPSPLRGTPLHYAAFWNLPSIVQLLVDEHSQNVNSQDFTGSATPLHVASERGRLEVVRMLIEHGADVSAQDYDSQTPLHLAAQAGRLEVTSLLIERGADVSARNQDGQTPLHLVSLTNWVPYFNFDSSRHPEVACMLIERGADVSAQDKDGRPPLHLALQGGRPEVARMLIERGADVSAQNDHFQTPLHPGSERGHLEVARVPIERGADVSDQIKDGRSRRPTLTICKGFSPSPKRARSPSPLGRSGRKKNSRMLEDGTSEVWPASFESMSFKSASGLPARVRSMSSQSASGRRARVLPASVRPYIFVDGQSSSSSRTPLESSDIQSENESAGHDTHHALGALTERIPAAPLGSVPLAHNLQQQSGSAVNDERFDLLLPFPVTILPISSMTTSFAPSHVRNSITAVSLSAAGMRSLVIKVDQYAPLSPTLANFAPRVSIHIKLSISSLHDVSSPPALHGFSGTVSFAAAWTNVAHCVTRVFAGGVCESVEYAYFEPASPLSPVTVPLPESELSRCRWGNVGVETRIDQVVTVDQEELAWITYDLAWMASGPPSAEILSVQMDSEQQQEQEQQEQFVAAPASPEPAFLFS